MFDILDLMRPLAILAAVLILYIHLYHRNVPRKNGFYMNPDWNYFFKFWFAKRKLNEIKINQMKLLNEKLLKKSERPLVLKNDKSSDTLIFYGTDNSGNSILLRMTRLRHRTADLWIVIRLNKTMVWTLPEHPGVRVYEATNGKFCADGLEFECLDSYSRWRITYSGFLRNQIRNEWTTDIMEENLKFVKFNFFFTASNNPFFYPVDWSSSLMANGIATEHWRDGNWSRALNVPGNGGYDQYGEIFGQIFLPNQQKAVELHLPGIRQRRWESIQHLNLRRYISIVGVTSTGCIFNIGAASFEYDLSHVQFGSVRLATGHVHPIDWTDFKIPDFADNENLIKNQISIHFRAGKNHFKAFIYLNLNEKINFIQGDDESPWNITSIPINFDLNADYGFGITTTWYPNKISIKPLPKIPIKHCTKLVYGNSLPSNSKLTLHFDDYEATSKNISGGKGASLSLLTIASNEISGDNEINFEIPNGFIVSTSAFRLFLNENSELFLKLRNLEDICYEKVDGDLELCCDAIEKLFSKAFLNKEIIESIRKSFNELNNSATNSFNQTFAVRSSGADEDGVESSCAGQNESFLGIKSFDEILNGILKCWSSLYSVRSVQYRRNFAQPIISEMAVVIQKMIASQFSGVLFTNDSVLNDTSNILITANFGLGESVVSGSVNPDTYVLTKNYNGKKLKIEEIIIGSKSHFVALKETGGTEILQNESILNESCLNDDLVVKLGQIGILLENMFGVPQDIEWSIAGNANEIYLLQSRPITIFHKFSNWEYLHEFDSPLMASNEVLSRGNVGEVLNGPIDHLTQSTILKILDEIPENELNIKKFPNLLPNVHFKISHHHAFIDILQILTKGFRNEKLDSLKKILLYNMLGSLEITPEIQKAIIDRGGVSDLKHTMKKMKDFISNIWNSSRMEKNLINFIEIFKKTYTQERMKSHENSLQSFNELNEIINKHFYYVIESHLKLSTANTFYQTIVMMVLYKKNNQNENEKLIDLINDTMKIMCGNNENSIISAEIPKKLNEIANLLYLYNDWQTFIEIEPLNGIEWLELNAPSAFRKFMQFLKNYGHRGFNEFIFSSKTWQMQPEILIKILQNNLIKSNLSGSTIPNTIDEIIETLHSPINKLTKLFLKKFSPFCCKSIERRELSKHYLIDFINILRQHFIHLSNHLYSEGLLPDRKLIFYLNRWELEKLIKNHEICLIQKAIRRQKLFKNFNKFNKFADLIIGVPKYQLINQNYCTSNDYQLNGIAVQCGLVIGRACVLKDISEVDKIKSGDILITSSTDIAWSPYFPILSGLVTELGGLISHGAIVAREYGLPCIVGATNATNIIKFGDEIILNADKGFVMKVK